MCIKTGALHTYRHRMAESVFGLLILSLLFAACSGSTATPSQQPTQSTNQPAKVTPALQFTTYDLKLPSAATNSPVVGPLPLDTVLQVGITFKINQAEVDKLGLHNTDKGGQNTDLQTIANQIGISDQTYQSIKNFFGVTDAKLQLNKLHTYLSVSAKAQTFASLFQTTFVIHRLNGRTFYMPATPPKLPTVIANNIVAITGLDSYSPPPDFKFGGQRLLTETAQQQVSTANCQVSKGAAPSDIASAYGYDQLWKRGWNGKGITVNLVELGGVYGSDIQNYMSCVKFQGKIGTVTVGKAPTTASVEATLDIEMVAGLAPGSNIVVYQTDINAAKTLADAWTLINNELQQIINDNTKNSGGNIVSFGLGSAEAFLSNDEIKALDQSFEILEKTEHLTVFVDSGDCAAFADGTYNSLSVSYPASDPYVVSVGGTILGADSSGRSVELAWSDGSNRKSCNNGWGTGGGVSGLFKQPTWQTGAGVKNQYSRGMRQVPDVSGIALGLQLYYSGKWYTINGTSGTTPIWAAGMALVNEGLIQQAGVYGYGPSLFYVIANNSNGKHPYYDITDGDNLYYKAAKGWDYPTGLGTPNMVDFYNVLYALATQH